MKVQREEISRPGLGTQRRTTAFVIRAEDFRWTGLRSTLEDLRDVSVVGETADWREALDLIGKRHPDAIFAPAEVRGTSIVVLAQQLRDSNPESKIIVLSKETNGDLQAALGRATVSGYLLWDDIDPTVLHYGLAAVVYAGLRIASPAAVEELLAAPEGHTHPRSRPPRLTEREWIVLMSLLADQTEKETAEALNLPLRTVQATVGALKRKLGARTLFTLGMRAHASGFRA